MVLADFLRVMRWEPSMKMNRDYQIMISLTTILFFVFTAFFSYNSSNAHLSQSNNTQVWNSTKDNIQIEFGYLPEIPIIDAFTNLAFSITNLQTGEHSPEGIAQVTVTNGQRLFKFQNVSVQNGDFSVDYLFPDDGTHQVLLRLDRNESISLASFQVFIPHQTPPNPLSDSQNSIIAMALLGGVAVITIYMIRKK